MICLPNWVCWARGNFSGEPGHVHICCASLRCVECRAGTSISGHSAGISGGTVRVFCFLGSVLASTVRLKWWGGGCCVFSFNFLQFCHFSWRVNMRGRDFVLYFTWYSVVASCGVFLYKLLIGDDLLQVGSENLAP
jgi:hypothetical protein